MSREVAIPRNRPDVDIRHESTNKVLRAWAQRSWIRLERGGIVVLDPDALAALIDIEAR